MGRWDDGTMGQWVDAADKKISREAHLTFPFSVFTFHFINSRRRHLTFPFSVFTFHFINSREAHHTFEAKLRNASTLLRLGIVNTFTLLSP